MKTIIGVHNVHNKEGDNCKQDRHGNIGVKNEIEDESAGAYGMLVHSILL